MSNSRRASRPTTRKKNVISPEFTQPRKLSARPVVPTRIDSAVCHVAAYPDESMFAQASAASAAASSTAALPVSVRRNWRSGVSRLRAHTVRSENSEAGESDSVTAGFSPTPRQHAMPEPTRRVRRTPAGCPGLYDPGQAARPPSGIIRERSNERRDHMTRLWGQEVEMYQSLLLEVQGARKIRRDIRWKFEGFADGEMGGRVSSPRP